MKKIFGISLMLNLALLASLPYLLVKRHEPAAVSPLVLSEAKPAADPATISVPPSPREMVTRPFRWSDLDSSNGYRAYIVNLRAIGCPETTIADIVRGNVGRAFSWECSRLHLDGSGSGPWSHGNEVALINDLLENSNASRQIAARQAFGYTPQADNSQGAPVSGPQSDYQNSQTPNVSSWRPRDGTRNAYGGRTVAPSANQSAGGQLNGDPNSEPNNMPVEGAKTSSNDHPVSDDPFTKSAQDIMAEQQVQYYDWYQPQVLGAAASSAGLFINPDDFHTEQ